MNDKRTPLRRRRYSWFSLLTPFFLFLWPGDSLNACFHSEAFHDPGKSVVRTIVIDPGHGGKDPGCLGKDSKEKEITLAMALALKKKIQTRHPDVKVILTREKDEFIPLHERTQLANKVQADLFISLHCNALENAASIRGSETYVLGLHRAEDNLRVARRENESILLEDNYKLNYGDFDPNSAEAYILISMYQSAYLDKSIVLASYIEDEIKSHAGRHSKGVKQAGFLVLREIAMPSVLVEAGFLTHADEEKFLRSESGQEKIAESLARAFTRYKQKVETENGGSIAVTLSEETESNRPSPKPVSINSKPKDPSTKSGDQIWHAVQLGALSKPLPSDHEWRTTIPHFMEKKEGTLYKYLSGPFQTKEEMEKIRKELLQSGIKGIFAVTYQGEHRIPNP